MSEIERRGGKSLLSSRSCEAEIPPGLQSPSKPSPGLRRHQAPQSGHSSPGPFPALRQEATGQPGSRDDLRLGGRGQGEEERTRPLRTKARGKSDSSGLPSAAARGRTPRRAARGPPPGSQPARPSSVPALTHTQLHHVGVIRPGHDQGDEDHGHPGQHPLAALEDVGRRHLPPAAAAGGIGAGATRAAAAAIAAAAEPAPGGAGRPWAGRSGREMGGPAPATTSFFSSSSSSCLWVAEPVQRGSARRPAGFTGQSLRGSPRPLSLHSVEHPSGRPGRLVLSPPSSCVPPPLLAGHFEKLNSAELRSTTSTLLSS